MWRPGPRARNLRRVSRRPRLTLVLGSLGALTCAAFLTVLEACLPGGGPPLLEDEDAAGGSLGLEDDGGLSRTDVDLGDPFALGGLSPSHGPFTGGTRALMNGRGFSSKLRVFLGDTEVPPASFLASDPTRAAIVTPAGPPGFVDVRIRNDETAQERVLKDGFYYDAFVVSPDTGATSGGTRITISGSGTAWASGTTVSIGGIDCTNVVVDGPTKLECVTPEGTVGSKDVTVTTLGGTSTQAREAFTYTDSPDGYRGGLSGGALDGRVRVLAFDSMTGTPIAGAFAIAGTSLATGIVQKTTASGVTEISGITGDKVTITVAAKCHQPMSFVDVPVDTVTAYIDPVLDVSCIEGDPPSGGGGTGRYGGVIEGELIFPGQGEFQRMAWTTVPAPTRPTERRAAYVFEAASSPSGAFRLPDASEAITPDTSGTNGYSFSIVTFPGNITIYVVAGLEDRSVDPPSFVPYSMGIARGVTVPAQTRVIGVDVAMDILFDHQVTLAPTPPAPGPRGPDRLASSVALTLGATGYAILPRGTSVVPLPAPATVPFVGVPSLDHAIAGEQYVLGAVAATGSNLGLPASVVSRIRTTNANDPVALGGFLGVPVLSEPNSGTWGGTHVEFSGANGPVDLSLVQIASQGGLVSWTVVAPGGVTSFDLPDISQLPGDDYVGLLPGAISTTVYVARIDDFSYGRLRSGQLAKSVWNAYAFDALDGVY